MTTLPLIFEKKHLFVEVDRQLLLLDTGAPCSFGTEDKLTLAERVFPLQDEFFGINREMLSDYIGVEICGLIGMDILSQFDIIFDVPNSTITFGDDKLVCSGETIPFDDGMIVPIIPVRIAGSEYDMLFDTGAQISYMEAGIMDGFPDAGNMTDFHPSLGRFQTDTYNVDMSIGTISFTVRSGLLSEKLELVNSVTQTDGIVGNEVMIDRPIGYFPKRREMIICDDLSGK